LDNKNTILNNVNSHPSRNFDIEKSTLMPIFLVYTSI